VTGSASRTGATIWGETVEFTAPDPDAAYADALLHLLGAGPDIPGTLPG
jgi:hypothetical protein